MNFLQRSTKVRTAYKNVVNDKVQPPPRLKREAVNLVLEHPITCIICTVNTAPPTAMIESIAEGLKKLREETNNATPALLLTMFNMVTLAAEGEDMFIRNSFLEHERYHPIDISIKGIESDFPFPLLDSVETPEEAVAKLKWIQQFKQKE